MGQEAGGKTFKIKLTKMKKSTDGTNSWSKDLLQIFSHQPENEIQAK